jgi:hypothetical protein
LTFSVFPFAGAAPFLWGLTSTGSDITGEFPESARSSPVECLLLFAAEENMIHLSRKEGRNKTCIIPSYNMYKEKGK